MARVAICVTSYNRPHLVADCIASVREQDTDEWTLYILDDGSNRETIEAINRACGSPEWWPFVAHGGMAYAAENRRFVWWQGYERSRADRAKTVSYSRNLNLALNFLVQEPYICYLVDDDFFYPEAIRPRVEYLEAHPEVHVITGRQRSLQYGQDGFNTWSSSAAPQSGRLYPRPTGRRVLMHGGCAAKTYFADPDERDPQTGLPFVEEATWTEGWSTYGAPCRHDHNSVLHRRECLTTCRTWPDGAALGGKMFWGEPRHMEPGDAAFFTLLGQAHQFYGLNTWVASKRYHAFSTGVVTGEVRE